MLWTNGFSWKAKEKGLELLSDGMLYDIEKRGDIYCAYLEEDGDMIRTEIQIRGDFPSKIRCSCGRRADRYCAHAAATLYAIEAGMAEDMEDLLPKEKLFTSVGKQYFFNMENMEKGFTFAPEEVGKARKLLEEGRMTEEHADIEVGFNRHGKKVLSIETLLKDGNREFFVSGTISRDRIEALHCNMPGCFMRYYDASYSYFSDHRSPCCHEIAALLMLDRYIGKYNPGDLTSASGNALLQAFRKERKQQKLSEGSPSQTVHLIPVLEWGGQLSLTFKIGIDKMYVLKDMTQMVQAYKKKEILPLGTKNVINFASASFDESSLGYLKLIQSGVNEAVHESRDFYDYNYLKKSMELYGRRLDDFFAIANGKNIECKGKKGTVAVREAMPEISLSVDSLVERGGKFSGIRLTGTVPEMLEGVDSLYAYGEGNYLLKVPEDGKEIIGALLATSEDGNVDTVIGTKSISEFFYRILPKLEGYVHVELEDENMLDLYIPPEGIFRFYMDNEDGMISCRPCVSYGEEELFLVGEEKKVLEYRDVLRESEVLKSISPFFEAANPKDHELFCIDDEEATFSLLTYGIDLMTELGEVHATDRFQALRIRRNPTITVGVSVESEILNLSVISNDISNEELLDILYSYRKKKRFHRLKNGDFVDLEDDTFAEICAVFDAMKVSPKEFVEGKMQIPAYRALYLDKMLEEHENIYNDRDRHFREMIRNFKAVKESDFEPPEHLKGIMRGYQRYGYKWLSVLKSYGFGGILSDEMGLGKTLQMIAVIEAAKGGGTSLIVCPASLVYNWQEEFERFAPSLRVAVIAGSADARKKQILAVKDYDAVITSYDLLRRDIDQYEGVSFLYEVIDEAQYIKNPATAAAKAVKVISARHRFALTGTPIENRLSELWSIFDYLMPGFLYSYEEFKRTFETPITKHRDEERSARLRRMVSPFILRRLKRDVLKDLPDKMEEVLYAKLSEEQKKLYDGQVVRMKAMLGQLDEQEVGKNRIQILAEITKLRQICCDPALLFDGYSGPSSKKDSCLDLIESAIDGGHRMLLFSQFTSMFDLLEEQLKKKKIPYYKITGATPKARRMELVKAFNSDETPLFLISLKAGGTGLNLTGADIVIHYDPWWNLAAENQATDRAHRIGQEKTVTVYRIIAKNTIEEKILKMQEDKKALADEILSGEGNGIMNMTKDEILNLF